MRKTDKYVISNEVLVERSRQDKKFGVQNHNPDRWFRILAEETGEAAHAYDEGDLNEYRTEMIQVAAVAQAAVESYDRQLAKKAAPILTEYHVARAATIRDFVETKTGKEYVPGNTYYEVQERTVLKGRREVLTKYAGAVTSQGTMPAGTIITPRAFSTTFFVQSTSLNRRLLANSRVLVKQ